MVAALPFSNLNLSLRNANLSLSRDEIAVSVVIGLLKSIVEAGGAVGAGIMEASERCFGDEECSTVEVGIGVVFTSDEDSVGWLSLFNAAGDSVDGTASLATGMLDEYHTFGSYALFYCGFLFRGHFYLILI